MTNLEHYISTFTEDTLVQRNIMDCRQCPLRSGRGVCCLTRKECEKKLRDWCKKEYIPEENDDNNNEVQGE